MNLQRLGCLSLLTLLLTMLTGAWWFSEDMALLRQIQQREEAAAWLVNKEPLEVLVLHGRATDPDDDRVLGLYAVDKERKLPPPVHPERLVKLLDLAFQEYAEEGRFPAKNFEPDYAFRWGQRVIVFSPALRALSTNIPGWDSCYFEVPPPLSRQLLQCIQAPARRGPNRRP